MRKAVSVLAIAAVVALAPSPAAAWGAAAHRYIMGRAIDLLPPELKPLFERYRTEIVVRSIDPDVWRSAGWDDDQNHFIDFGVKEYGDYPFEALPREYGAAIEKFGYATVKKNGLLPWREAEEFGNLRRAFERFRTGSPFGHSDVVLFAAVLGHYVQDANQPLHATENYDGNDTGNNGIHSRFETQLFDRFQMRLTINPKRPKPILNARDAAFDTLLDSYRLVEQILKADSEAIGDKDAYDDDYFERFLAKVQPILERRLADSITDTAGLIIGAWAAAGKPTVTLDAPRPVQKRRRPGQ